MPRGGSRRSSVGRAKPPARRTGVRKGPRGAESNARTRGDERRGLGGDQVEGRQAVRELLLAGRRRVRELWIVSGERSQRGPLHDVAELAQELRVPIKYVSQGKLDAAARSEAPQGVLARCAPLPEADLDELAEPVNGEPPFLIALDGVTDPGNFGALLRVAECCGATGVVVPRHRSVHVTPTVAKAAAGAIEHLPIAVVGGLPAALDRLAKLGVWTVGLDSGGSERIDRLGLADQPVVLVLGAEGRGLSPLVRRRCEVVVAIPLRGRLGSLNVASAGAIACFEVARRRLDAREPEVGVEPTT
jgi:23S rRNA (guanosine2251-2'-O)-methyltransferase